MAEHMLGSEGAILGRGAADYYLPLGRVGAGHSPGDKKDWTDAEHEAFPELRLDEAIPRHVGGGGINYGAWLAVAADRRIRRLRFVSVLGADDPESLMIAGHLERLQICGGTLKIDGYLPGIGLVERAAIGSDRMIRCRPSQPLEDHLTDDHIERTFSQVDLAAVVSIGSMSLVQSAFRHAPDKSFLAYNPGRRELEEPHTLQQLMTERQPHLLALNDGELRRFWGVDPEADIQELITRATALAKFVLCTMGDQGAALASNGDIVHMPVERVHICDTLGAGDRAFAVATEGLMADMQPRAILSDIVASTSRVIQREGGHADLYDYLPVA